MPVTELGNTRVAFFVVRLFLRSIARLLLLFALCSSGTTLFAQKLEIKLVNGRNGHPIAGTCINVWVGNERKAAIAIPTDENGVARLRLTDKDSEIDLHKLWKDCGEFGIIDPVVKYNDTFRINAGYVLCQTRPPSHSWLGITDLSTKDVLQHGIVTTNACGKATASPKRGAVILFVRSLSWWEKLKQ